MEEKVEYLTPLERYNKAIQQKSESKAKTETAIAMINDLIGDFDDLIAAQTDKVEIERLVLERSDILKLKSSMDSINNLLK